MLDDNKEVKISIITGYGKSKLNKRIKKIKQGGKEVIQNNRRNQKKQSGITLVALVVTMLILIILATVTINAVLGDNGLIKQAQKTKDIAEDYIAKEEEDMNRLAQEYANMMAEDNNPSLPEDKTPPTVDIVVGEVTETSIAVTVNATDDSGEIGSYKYYINGEEKTTSATNTYTFSGLTAGTEYTIKVEAFDKANNKGENSTKASTTKPSEPTVEEKLKEGDYVTYPSPSGNLACRVLYDSSSGYGVQLITSNSVTNIYILGTPGDFEGNKTLYNKVISTLNSAVSSYNNSTYGTVRCVGSVPNNPSQDSAGYFTSSYSYMSSYNGQFKNTDTNYTTDYNQMGTLGIRNIGNPYWLASRYVFSDSNYSYFCVRRVDSSGGLYYEDLCNVKSSGNTLANMNSVDLRPVFTLKSDIKVTGGNGESGTPYTLGV